jgi:two-component system chemotaxis response regulator CheY
MPVMDGYEFLCNLRRMPAAISQRWCSAPPKTTSRTRALHAGANEYIMKPFDKEIVTAKFQEVGLI